MSDDGDLVALTNTVDSSGAAEDANEAGDDGIVTENQIGIDGGGSSDVGTRVIRSQADTNDDHHRAQNRFGHGDRLRFVQGRFERRTDRRMFLKSGRVHSRFFFDIGFFTSKTEQIRSATRTKRTEQRRVSERNRDTTVFGEVTTRQ